MWWLSSTRFSQGIYSDENMEMILTSNRKDWLQADEMVQGINALAVMPNNLSSTPRPHMVDPKSWPLSFTKVLGHTHALFSFKSLVK